ncbi:MAG: DUF3800 domain-containing protein [Eubacteriales bacterium]|nr:DUF3800 domain-containing protein [Eubacteriales bacterium]
METYISYFDETGDDGVTTASSDIFVLSSIYMSTQNWQKNYDDFKLFRTKLKSEFGMHVSEEMHTMHFLRDKGLYRPYGWTLEQRREILTKFAVVISRLDIKVINVIIDKNNIKTSEYAVLENALTYNIQRIENDSDGKWKYIIITDEGRIAPMRKTARKLRAYNPVSSHFGGMTNIPIKGLVEDILEKNSEESYFIQICDYISCFVSLYYKYVMKDAELPKRIAQVIDKEFISRVLATFKSGGILNEKASSAKYGLVIYPR